MQDGKQKSFHGRMYFKGNHVYIGTDVPTGHVYAFDKEKGMVSWKHFAGQGVPGDIIGMKDRIYALTKEDTLLCLDRENGSVLWRFHTGSQPDELNYSSPCIAGGRIYFRDTNRYVYAFNAGNGKKIWEREFPADLSTSISERNDDLFVGALNGMIYSLDAKNGDIKQILVIGEIPTGTILHTGKQLLFFTGERGTGNRICAIDKQLKKILWQRAAGEGSYWSTYRMHPWQDYVLVGDNEGNIVAFESKNGKGCGWLTVPGVVKTITHSDEQLFVGTFQGVLYSFWIEP
jgi:outer membrane protein assembly factor BamB